MDEDSDDMTNQSILYEALEYFIRKQEPEVTKCKNDSVVLPTPGHIKNALRYLNNRYSLPESISQQISYTLPWKFAIGDKGHILAIVQENIIEIRKSKDEYSSIIGKASIVKDAFPQWRKLAWSPDGSILVLAASNGYVSFYNTFGNNIFNITPKSLAQNPNILEAGDATASIIFKKPNNDVNDCNYEFIRVTFSGLLQSYYISGNQLLENHEFSFGKFYRNGVNSVVYSNKHNLFFVAGNSINHNLTCTASQIGLTCWRILNDKPYYKLSVSSQDFEVYKSPFSIWNFIPIIKSGPQSIIFKTSISPNNHLISCLHTDGTISIWNLPTLKLQKQWKLLEQPNYNEINPLKITKCKKSSMNISEFQPLDIGWWSDNTIIIARYSGSVSVCSVKSLQNLLGTSPEYLYNQPQIAELGENTGFLCLGCEILVTSSKRNRESNIEEHVSELSSESEKDEEESKPITILNYITILMQSVLYSITDIEKFQPKRRKSKVCHRTYKLLGLKSTTPEELYSRKIEIEEYEEALSLASTYKLDPDLVYQTQWRKSEFSVDDIKKYLSKVSKRSWVLNECVSRVPENLEATRELINFGLAGANLETLIAIEQKDNGKFTCIKTNNDIYENSKKLNHIQQVNQILDANNKGSLNESQKELIRYRKKLLNHLDKLKIYEIFLESSSKFNKTFYEEFRKLLPVENAIRFAKSNNCRGVEIMFTYYADTLMPYWLTIISFFPETLNPEKYQKLLPEYDIEGRLCLLYQEELRQKDWVDRSSFSDIYPNNSNDLDYIYENRRSLLLYRNKELTEDLLEKWYKNRAYEIENNSSLVDNALSLIYIGKSHNINGLETLLLMLETLADLVYKVNLENLSLNELEKLSDLEKIRLLMTKCNEKNFILNIKTMLLPYLRRRTQYLSVVMSDNLLHEYLVYLSIEDLKLPLILFEHFESSYDSEILNYIQSTDELAINCIYACNDIEMYLKAKAIFEIVINLNRQKEISMKYVELEKELKCLHLLNEYQVKIPLHHIVKCKQNAIDAKALLIQMNENFTNMYSVKNENHWSQILNDMLNIQKNISTSLDIQTCFEIALIYRLKSGSKTTIQGCFELIEVQENIEPLERVPYKKAVDLILKASNNYFNNSKSLRDPFMELASECLDLIRENDERVIQEYDLIESLKILNEFQMNILPLQVRITEDKIKFIEDCLNSQHDAYKYKRKLINLSKCLRIIHKNDRLREGKVLSLIVKKSFELKDYDYCASIMKKMIESNYQLAWSLAMNLAYCNDYDDLIFRKNCIWFAIKNGPSDILEKLMEYANLLQAQILNNDLEKWMPIQTEDLEYDTTPNNFSDDFNTIKTNDFVPKLVQTSTNLVKNSALMVKQSTFDLIKNAGNKDFWKSKLNFTFIDNSYKEVQEDEIIESKKDEQLQKFPCFYESLHENCGISNLDTNYSKYSQVDYNPELKLYQTLLRISLLSETASYGEEVSSNNHLLLKCAEHTITEDCTMGLSYLLHLNDDYIIKIINLSESLPQTQLYNQIFAYFFSIELYAKKYSEINKVFLYDPIKLIQHMKNIQVNDNLDDQKQLKRQINFLIKTEKVFFEEKFGTDTKNTIVDENNGKKKSNFNNELEHKKEFTLEYTDPPKDVDEWNDWGNEWPEMLDSVNYNKISESNKKTADCSNVSDFEKKNLLNKKFYEMFEDELLKMQKINDYERVKIMLIDWFKIKKENMDNIRYSNLILKTILKLIDISKINSDNNDLVLKEIKELLQKELISQEEFIKFLQEKKDIFTREQYVYLQLCSKKSSLQQEAILYIKENHKTLVLNTIILEEIFFNNLTCLFSVTHDLYYQIIEEVFINRTLPEIENNIKLLIDDLVKQKNIPHAIALMNQLEGIPQSLSTYGNCFKLLLRK